MASEPCIIKKTWRNLNTRRKCESDLNKINKIKDASLRLKQTWTGLVISVYHEWLFLFALCSVSVISNHFNVIAAAFSPHHRTALLWGNWKSSVPRQAVASKQVQYECSFIINPLTEAARVDPCLLSETACTHTILASTALFQLLKTTNL